MNQHGSDRASIDGRLEAVVDEWRSLRYEGPALPRAPRRVSTGWTWPRLAWALPAAATLAVSAWLVSSQIDRTPWPETLRPVVYGSPLLAPPTAGARPAFSVPTTPPRRSCFLAPDEEPCGRRSG